MDELGGALRRAIVDVPDFPKAGIVFKDITPVLADPDLFRRATEAMAEPFRGERISHVVAIESRGFILGGPIALALGAAFVPMRKPGKLPRAVVREAYALEYGTDALEMHADALLSDPLQADALQMGPDALRGASRVLVVDDVLATGGTAAAACKLVVQGGGEVVACSFLMELTFLGGRSRLGGVRAAALLTC